MAHSVEATDIADTDAVLVVTYAVSSRQCDRASFVDATIEVDDVVVADAVEATGTVPPVDVGYGEGMAFLGGTTVDDDFVNAPIHGPHILSDNGNPCRG